MGAGLSRSVGPALAAMLLSACAAPPGGGGTPDPDPASLQALLAPLAAAQRFSGAVVLMRDGRVMVSAGVGIANPGVDGEAPRPFTPTTPSDGGSLAKTFTAAGVQWLVHEGRLALADPVRRWVPAYPHEGVTVGQLIAHASGLTIGYEAFDAHVAPGEIRTTDRLLALAARLQPAPAFVPGSRFAYADLPYDAAARVLEGASGQDYARFVQDRFFRPLGLEQAFARPAWFVDWPVPRTRGARFDGRAWQPHDAYDGEAFLGASNLVFSALDLARWGDAWARGVAVPAAVERAGRERPRLGGRRSGVDGLGWTCSDDGARCHALGELNAFHAFVHWDRARRETVAFVANAALPPWPRVMLQRRLVALVAGSAVVPVPGSAVAPVPGDDDGLVVLEPAAVAALAGRYRLEPEGLPGDEPGPRTATITPGADGPKLRLDDAEPQRLQRDSPVTLHAPALGLWLAVDDGGRRLRLQTQAWAATGLRIDDGP